MSITNGNTFPLNAKLIYDCANINQLRLKTLQNMITIKTQDFIFKDSIKYLRGIIVFLCESTFGTHIILHVQLKPLMLSVTQRLTYQ